MKFKVLLKLRRCFTISQVGIRLPVDRKQGDHPQLSGSEMANSKELLDIETSCQRGLVSLNEHSLGQTDKEPNMKGRGKRLTCFLH